MGHNSAKIFFGLSVMQVCVLLLIVNNSPLYKTWLSYPPVIFVHCLNCPNWLRPWLTLTTKKDNIQSM